MLVAGTTRRPCASDGESGKLTCSDTPLRPHIHTLSFTADRPKGGILVEGYTVLLLLFLYDFLAWCGNFQAIQLQQLCDPNHGPMGVAFRDPWSNPWLIASPTRAINKKKMQNTVALQFGITVNYYCALRFYSSSVLRFSWWLRICQVRGFVHYCRRRIARSPMGL